VLRLFVAAYPPPEVTAHLDRVVSSLTLARPPLPGRSLRLTPPQRWHVTLAFLGDVADDRAAVAAAALQAVGAGATRWAPIRVCVAGAGRFGRGRFTTVWAGLRGDLAGLGALAAATRREVKRARLPFDPKPFRPHITLARPGDRLPAEELALDLETLNDYEGPQWTVEDVRLVRSFLGPEPSYETLASAGDLGRPS
jgi:2'-5' RNA ligase